MCCQYDSFAQMDIDRELEDPASGFALSVFKLYGLLMRNGERITHSVGQSSAKWQVLGRAGSSPQSVAQMARDMGLARQSVQRVANGLEEAGLVTFKDIPDDQRTYLVEITQRGLVVLQSIYELNRVWKQKVLQRVSHEILTEITSELERLALVFEELEKEEEGQIT